MKKAKLLLTTLLIIGSLFSIQSQEKFSKRKISNLKQEVSLLVEEDKKKTQVMIDKVFSFGELGFHEFETSKYLSKILEENGFDIEYQISGIPTSWLATWSNGEGGPTIALGSDFDGVPSTSQYPGVAYEKPVVEGAPGHGEGHNIGLPIVITSAISIKKIMIENNISGTLVLWPGVAEEILGAKAWYVRDGYFDNVDMCIFTHVSTNMSTSWGRPSGTGLISVKYTFSGETAHSAGSPWRARSALDAAELMNVGWNYKREHLHPDQRSHSIFLDAGDQPNVVPSKASIWYFLREITYKNIMEMYDTANKMAEGAALMTDTSYESEVLGAAWPRHFNKIIAEEMYENIKKVGLPKWSEDDQTLARAVQKEIGSESINGLPTELPPLREPLPYNVSGGSDDIGDVSWKVPTVVLRFPSNIPDVTFHHWSASIAAATPIAHKGANAGAKVVAMTVIDFLTKPEKLDEAKDYFNNVQSKEDFYRPMISEKDPPPFYLNTEKMEKYRDQMEKFYFDETKYDTYLEQLGVDYPEINKPGNDKED
ncbi:MAG: amidohydrolase [Candidatus Marisimplicoccus sp.]